MGSLARKMKRAQERRETAAQRSRPDISNRLSASPPKESERRKRQRSTERLVARGQQIVDAFLKEVQARGDTEADLLELMRRPHDELDRVALDVWHEVETEKSLYR